MPETLPTEMKPSSLPTTLVGADEDGVGGGGGFAAGMGVRGAVAVAGEVAGVFRCSVVGGAVVAVVAGEAGGGYDIGGGVVGVEVVGLVVVCAMEEGGLVDGIFDG